ncbi:hypothetical protein [Tateyamaria sp. Alg231-49]|uniref:hypothetical protein n=1 Tax=Tateyamaria sp. Alg231-49 TaxID=1922219 RepID=UPI00131EE881|nr:hypothetical protein [Tateyamaria sp. Alg231-49]
MTELISARKNDPIQKCLEEFREHGTYSEACEKDVTIDWPESRGIDEEEDPAQTIPWE